MTAEQVSPTRTAHGVTAQRPHALSSAGSRSSTVAWVTIVATLLVAVGDRLSGPYLVFATFYLPPVAAAAWFVGRRFAVLVGALSAVAGLTATAMQPEALEQSVYVVNELLRFALYVVVAVLVSAVHHARREIEDLAAVDPLTRLLSRGRFYEQGELEILRARRSGRPLAVVYVDIDDLKVANDTKGHSAGDQLLTAFAESARSTFRSTDLLGRVGGDEFCFLLPEADDASANEAVYRLRRHVDHAYDHEVRFSAGVLSGVVPAALDIESAVHQADVLMMEAKALGKDRSKTRAGFKVSLGASPPSSS